MRKICPNCNIRFEAKTKRKIYCSEHCRRIKYRQNNLEEIRKKDKKYYTKNKERNKEKYKQRYQQNKEKYKQHYQQNKEKLKQYDKRYYRNNKKKKLEYQKKYRQTIVGKANENNKNHKRRAQCKETDITATWLALLKEEITHCSICGVKLNNLSNHDAQYNLDHIIPLSTGGKHCKENVRFICKRCNLLKSNI